MAVIEVEIGRATETGTFTVEVVSSPAGEASATVSLDVERLLTRMGELQDVILASSVSGRRMISRVEQPVQQVGREMFTALLGAGEVSGRYRSSAALADARNEALRVVVRIADPALAALPWEAMYDHSLGTYVCRQQHLVRRVPVPRVPPPLRVSPPLRILGIASSPGGLPPLDVEQEQEQLTRALSHLSQSGLVELRWAAEATWEHLQELLLGETWHIVHFVGHGDFDPARDTGLLALVREDGRANPIDAHQLVDLLRQARPMPRLVVLNSCSGAATGQIDLFAGTAATLVQAGVTAVTAMQFEISDHAAIAFSRAFYTALSVGRGVDDAVSSGRAGIIGLTNRTLEWVTPVLYLRGDQTKLFDIADRSQDVGGNLATQPTPPPPPPPPPVGLGKSGQGKRGRWITRRPIVATAIGSLGLTALALAAWMISGFHRTPSEDAYHTLISHLPTSERTTCEQASGLIQGTLASAKCHTGSYALYDSPSSAENAILAGAIGPTCNYAPSNLGKEYVHAWNERGRSGLFRCAVNSLGDDTVLIKVSWTFDGSPVYAVFTATSRSDLTTRKNAYWNLVHTAEAIRRQVS